MIDDFIPSANLIIGGIVTGLVVAAIVAYVKRRRLYLIVPRLFSYSQLSTSGQVIELTVLNKGNRSEENVEVKLAPHLTYEIIASTSSRLDITKHGVIEVPRLSQGDAESIVVNVEGGRFEANSVLSISSSTTKGKIRKKLRESEGTSWKLAIFACAIALIAAPFSVYTYVILVDEVWSRIKPVPEEIIAAKTRLTTIGWTDIERFVSSDYYTKYRGEWPIEVAVPQRRDEFVRFQLKFKNNLDQLVSFTADTASPSGRAPYQVRREWRPNDFESGIVLPPGESTRRTLDAYLPANAKFKLVILDFLMEVEGNSYYFKYIWHREQNE